VRPVGVGSGGRLSVDPIVGSGITRPNYRISTTIKTLKRAWGILRDMNLDGLLTGNPTEINLVNILNKLLGENGLVDLLQVITGNEHPITDFDEMTISEVTSILAAFFAAIKEAFPDVAGLMGKVVS